MDAITKAINKYEATLAQIGGCQDHGCMIIKPKGMGTNGGCRCARSFIKTQRLAHAAATLVTELKAAARPKIKPRQADSSMAGAKAVMEQHDEVLRRLGGIQR